MPRKQLIVLFVCSLINFTVGNAITGLMPVYLTRLGGDTVASGNFFSILFLMLTLGSLSAGWLSERFQRRKVLLILAGIPSAPLTWMMAQTTDIGQLSLLNGVSTYFAGMGIALINILAGLFAGESERGRVFGILGFAATLGGLIGGFGSGPIVDRWGFPALLQILAVWSVLFPLVALFAADRVVVRQRPASGAPVAKRHGLGASVYFLLLANVMVWLVGFTSSLARPLMMDQMGFDSTAISGAVGIGALATLPLAPMIGWLSDRLGRKRFLASCYLGGGLGLLLLSVSVSVWHFWLSAALLALIGASGGVGLAQVADLAPRAALDRAISLFSSTTFIAGIIGSAGTGYLIRGLGMTPTLLTGAALALLAILLLSLVRPPALQPGVSSA